MKLLISPVSMEEARAVLEAQADIVDIKNVKEGSLGAQFPWHIQEIVDFVRAHNVLTSATLGDLPYKPGTAAQAAYGVANLGVNFIKAGLYGLNSFEQACEMMAAIKRGAAMASEEVQVVAAGYADYRRFNGLNTWDLVRAAKETGCNVVMVDTAIKDGKTLFDALTIAELQDFVGMAREAGMLVALAGSIKTEHADMLRDIDPDIIGVRGAVCGGPDRHTQISVQRTREFIQLFRRQPAVRAGD